MGLVQCFWNKSKKWKERQIYTTQRIKMGYFSSIWMEEECQTHVPKPTCVGILLNVHAYAFFFRIYCSFLSSSFWWYFNFLSKHDRLLVYFISISTSSVLLDKAFYIHFLKEFAFFAWIETNFFFLLILYVA